MEFLATIRQQIKDFFAKMERGQMIRLAVLLLLVIGISITTVALLSRKTYAPLPVSGDATKMGEVNARLTELNIDKKVDSSGTIMVPEDQVDQVVWQLASDGIFNDDFTYNWIAQGTGFSSTESMQDAYSTIQIAENLRKMINGLHKIYDSKVILNIEKEPPFVYSPGRKESTAAVTIMLADSENPLTPQEAASVRQLIKMVGGGIKDENITVVDNLFNYYDADAVNAEPEVPLADRLSLQYRIQNDLAGSLKKFFEPVFGVGKVDVRVAAELNFNKVTEQSIVFTEPVEGMNSGLPIAWKKLYETVNNASGVAQGEPGLDENGGAPSYVEQVVTGSDSIYRKISEEVNAEINETKTMIERAQGNIENLSVSVLIPMDDTGEDYTEQVRNLASGAAGFPVQYVTVERLPFIETPNDALDAFTTISQQAEQYQLIRLLIIIGAIVLVVVLLLIALRTVLKALRPAPEIILEAAADEDAQGIDLLAGDEDEALLQEARVDTPVSQIQRFIEKDPESVAQLLRNWLTEDYR